jgi:rfaE bifunctional protein kinase chain/domain
MNAREFLERIKDLRVLVIGDAMLDHYILGDAHRISPEAPVPIIHVTGDQHTAGGAANVALNLAALGASVGLAARIGEDSHGRELIAILHRHGVATGHCLCAAGASTIVKTRVVARGHQLCRIDREDPRDAYQLRPGEEALAAMFEGAGAVIVSDYAKGVIGQELLDRVLARARTSGTLVAADPKPSRHLDYHGVGLLTPNRHEALELAGLPEPAPGEAYPLDEVFARIHAAHAPDLLAVTLGAGGMAIGGGGRVAHKLPTVARDVFDVSGAGDTVIAVLTAALAVGADPAAAAALANHAAGIVVSKTGTATVVPAELLDG